MCGRRSPAQPVEATESAEPYANGGSDRAARGRGGDGALRGCDVDSAEALVGDGAATAGAPRRSWRRRCRLAEAATDARSSLAAPGAVTSGRSLAR
ncbi:Os08g0219880 [Oryza sativa Japonica Group]|uniref:Os08g0219880 protein n=1 Tax=Oryza sativa subsp. japonica TaxID=39947 RepID=A0A0P0XCY5_ORYSJ|nr:Os08g0219880 [Oryza sativa Japonica Group]